MKTVHAAKLKKLRAARWKSLSVTEFLHLSDEEAMLVELRLDLADAVKVTRGQDGIG